MRFLSHINSITGLHIVLFAFSLCTAVAFFLPAFTAHGRWLVVVFCIVLFVAAVVGMFYQVFQQRLFPPRDAPKPHSGLLSELVWMLIPILTMVVLAWPVVEKIFKSEGGVQTASKVDEKA